MSDHTHTGGPFPELPGYRIECELGRGGMGVVYKAWQARLERYVALKVLPPQRAAEREAVETLVREARVAADLRHPNIAVVFDIGQEGDRHYFSMEYVEGRTFDEVIVDRSVDFKEKLTILVKAAEGLEYAHSRGLIHRDIKPSNIMIDGQHRVKLMDFGLVQDAGGDGGSGSASSEFGTVGFVAPEQAHGKEIDKRADVYSLGGILYDIVAFHKSSHRVNHTDPNDIEAIALKAMAHAPDKRYPSARAFIEDVERYLRMEPVQARPSTPLRRLVRWSRRNRQLAAALAVIALLVAGFGVYYTVQGLLERSRWRLVFADNFERSTLGKNWRPFNSIWIDTTAAQQRMAGRFWKIKEGELVCQHRFNTFILLNRPLNGDIRMEFDVCLPDSFNDGIGFFMFSGLEQGKKIDDLGYCISLGAFNKTRTYIKRKRFRIRETLDFIPENGGRYHVVAVRQGYDLTVSVDGRKVLEAIDYFPIIERDAPWFGFHSWKGVVHYDNVKIYRSTLPLKANPLKFADRLTGMEQYEEAVLQYEDIIEMHEGSEIALVASYKVGHAWLLARQFDRAVKRFDRVMEEAGDHPIKNMAMVEKGMAYYSQGREDKARAVFDRVVNELPGSYYISEIARMYAGEVKKHLRDEKNFIKALHLLREELRYSVTAVLKRNSVGVMVKILEILGSVPSTPGREQEVEGYIRYARQNFVRADASDFHEFLNHATLYMQLKGDRSRARVLLKELRGLDSKSTDARALRNIHLHVNILMSEGRYADALAMLEQGHARHRQEVNAPTTLFLMASLALMRDDFEQAEAHYRRVSMEYPELPWYSILAENALGSIALLRKDYTRARTHFERGISLSAGGRQTAEVLAVRNSMNAMALLTGDWNHVIPESLYIHLEMEPEPEHFAVLCERLYLQGLINWHRGRLKEKDRYFKGILQMYRYQPFVLMAQLCLDRVTESDYLDRMKEYSRADIHQLYFGLAEYFYLRKEYRKALHYYRRAADPAFKFQGIDLYHLQAHDFYKQIAETRIASIQRLGIR